MSDWDCSIYGSAKGRNGDLRCYDRETILAQHIVHGPWGSLRAVAFLDELVEEHVTCASAYQSLRGIKDVIRIISAVSPASFRTIV